MLIARSRLAAIFICIAVTGISTTGYGQRRGRGELRAAIDRRTDAAREQEEAKTALALAETEQKSLAQRLRTEFTNGEEWTAAQQELTSASGDLEAARQRILDQLQTDPAYQSALKARAQASADLSRVGSGASPADRAALANKVQTATLAVKRIEDSTFTADSSLQSLQVRVDSARAAIKALEAKRERAVSSSTELDEVGQRIRAAQIKKAAAEARFKEADQRANELEFFQDEQRRQNLENQRRQQQRLDQQSNPPRGRNR